MSFFKNSLNMSYKARRCNIQLQEKYTELTRVNEYL